MARAVVCKKWVGVRGYSIHDETGKVLARQDTHAKAAKAAQRLIKEGKATWVQVKQSVFTCVRN